MNDSAVISEARRACLDGWGRTLRVTARLTQADVAKDVRTTPSAISRWERNERVPRSEAAYRYGMFLRSLRRGQ